MLKALDEEHLSFSLQNFSGPLDLLIYLIQKHEIDVQDVPISCITNQYLDRLLDASALEVDEGAEFLVHAALLILIKSQKLLPKHKKENEAEEVDPRFELLPKLIDYYQFKGIAKELANRERSENCYFPRGVTDIGIENSTSLGVEHLTIDDIGSYFNDALEKVASRKKEVIDGEAWSVSDKVDFLRLYFQKKDKLSFSKLFSPDDSREELIVTFLAVLEMMKLGEVVAMRDSEKSMPYLSQSSGD